MAILSVEDSLDHYEKLVGRGLRPEERLEMGRGASDWIILLYAKEAGLLHQKAEIEDMTPEIRRDARAYMVEKHPNLFLLVLESIAYNRFGEEKLTSA